MKESDSQILTALEFLKKEGWPNPDFDFENDLVDTMVSFAKYHVIQALKSVDLSSDDFLCGNSKKKFGKYAGSCGKWCGGCDNPVIDQDLVIASYPLTNIT
jgi:hypothetical protein